MLETADLVIKVTMYALALIAAAVFWGITATVVHRLVVAFFKGAVKGFRKG